MHEALLNPIFNCYKETENPPPRTSQSSNTSYEGAFTSLSTSSSTSSCLSSAGHMRNFHHHHHHHHHHQSVKKNISVKRNDEFYEIGNENINENDVFERSFMFYHKPDRMGDGIGAERLPIL